MASQSFEAEDGSSSAVARLTVKERECLSRWLDHATAKEIALDLGISHHAVEKRLKSARQKLGVATTLDAARLLAAAEGYGRTTSGAPEVAQTTAIDETERADAQPGNIAKQPRRSIITGVTIMSLLLLSAAVLSSGALLRGADTTSQVPVPEVTAMDSQPSSSAGLEAALGQALAPEVTVIDTRSGKSADIGSAFDKLFARLDKDGSGYLEGSELNRTPPLVTPIDTRKPAASQTSSASIGGLDTDGDRRISLTEYRAGMSALTARLRTALPTGN